MAAAQPEAYVAALNERLFLASDKDITFELADGCEHAHKAVLRAASDAFASMFEHPMKEAATSTVKLPDVKRRVMRTFLRLVYTGCVDKSDWAERDAPEEEQAGSFVLKKSHMQIAGRQLTSTREGDRSSVLLAGGGQDSFSFTVRAENWLRVKALLGIAPAGGALFPSFWAHRGFWFWADNGAITAVHGQEGTNVQDAAELPKTLPLPKRAEVTVKFESGALCVAVNNGGFVAAPFSMLIPTDAEHAPAICLRQANMSVEVVDRGSGSQNQCPLDVLVGVASLAQQYMIEAILTMCTSALKERVSAAKLQKDTGSFEQIHAAAISHNMFGVRLAALEAAKDFAELRRQHDAGALNPVVAADLREIWPASEPKRRKLAAIA